MSKQAKSEDFLFTNAWEYKRLRNFVALNSSIHFSLKWVSQSILFCVAMLEGQLEKLWGTINVG